MTSRSATCRRCGWRRVRRWPWSAPRAPASPRSRCCSPASTTSAAVRSGSAATTSGTSRRTPCARRSGWCWRTASCSPTASPKTSPSAGRTQPGSRSWPRRGVMRDRTTLLIAHRRSTLRLADRIAVLDEGRLVAEGTHEELLADCPLYRLLLAGPGDDAEGIDAGELGFYQNDPAERNPDRAAPVRAAAAVQGPAAGEPVAPARSASRQLRDSASGGFLAGIPASPELLAQVDALPPASETPGVDTATARAPDPHFTLRRLLRPFLIAFAVGLVLDGLDALASLAMPALVRGGIDHGIETGAVVVIGAVSLAALLITGADWVINAVQTTVVGRTGERLLYTLRVKIFAHLQRLGLDYYERELSGRIMTRMTTDVEALSSFLQTGLITMVSSLLTFIGVLAAMLIINVRLGLFVLAIMPFLIAATVVFRVKSSRAYTEAREKVSVVNADLAENVAGLRVTQAFRREDANRARFAGRSFGYRQSRLRAQRYIALYFPFVQTLSTVASTLVLVLAVGQVQSGALTTGALIAYLLYIDMVFSPLQQLSQVFDGYQQAA